MNALSRISKLVLLILVFGLVGTTPSFTQAEPNLENAPLKQAVFIIMDTSLTNMQGAGVPTDVTDELEGLLHQMFIGEAEFTAALVETIGEDATEEYKSTILTYSIGHPFPQPFLPPAAPTLNGDTWTLSSNDGKSIFLEPEIDPFTKPPGTNFLPTVYTNMFDGNGVEMPNTLPSTPAVPYNLHEPPKVSEINRTSPTDDLQNIFAMLLFVVCQGVTDDDYKGDCEENNMLVKTRWEELGKLMTELGVDALKSLQKQLIDLSIRILEGEHIPNRAYSGYPLLHYKPLVLV